MPKRRKPTELHLVTGTLHPTKHANRAHEPKPIGDPKKPHYLLDATLESLGERIAECDRSTPEYAQLRYRLAIDTRASAIWDEDLRIAPWLTSADARPFAEWCRMSAQLETEDRDSAWRTCWRMIGSELGFFNASRSKISAKGDGSDQSDHAEKYFN